MKDGVIWFIAADVCGVLELKKPSNSIKKLDEDEKGALLTGTLGGDQVLNVVNEFGLYALILRSRKPSAREFQRWVTHEVLPAIRKTGRYEAIKSEDKLDPDTKSTDHVSRTQSNLNGVNVWLPEPGQYHVTVAGDGSYLLSKPLHDPVPFRQQTGDLHLLGSSVIAISALWLQNRLKYPPLTNGTYPHLHSLDLEIVKAQHIAEECMNKSKI